LPVVVNWRVKEPVHELCGEWVYIVENTEDGYGQAIKELVTNHERREALGQRGYQYAWSHFNPDKMEHEVVDLYRELVPNL
jgi:glycosyltransferase involved in cell wall biosynthesis